MSNQFIGEIRMFGGDFAPSGWAICDGQLLSIADDSALYALVGTTYGGDGVQTFGVPDLRGRLPIHQGTGQGLTPRVLGGVGGNETVTVTLAMLPTHAHAVFASTNAGTLDGPAANAVPATPTNGVTPFLYVVPGTSPFATGPMGAGSIGSAGGNGAHANLMPSQCLSFIIARNGIYPSQT